MNNKIPKIIGNVSRSIFSVSIKSGGAIIDRQEYVYIQKDDTLVLKSYLSTYKKQKQWV